MRGTVRQRLTLAVVGITTVMLILLVVGFNLVLRASLDADVNRALEARAKTVAENVDLATGQVNVGEADEYRGEDALVWVFRGNQLVSGPGEGDRLDRVAASLVGNEKQRYEDPKSELRLYARPIEEDDHTQTGTVVAGIDLEPYRETTAKAAVGSAVLAALMLVLIAITTRMVVGLALKPVGAMTREAASWSERDLDRRFNQGEPRDELTRLAATFDTMLDRMAGMIRHERNFSAELSHELRTPLAAISAESELALRRERSNSEYQAALKKISEGSAELTRILEILLDVSRSEGSSQSGETLSLPTALAVAAETAAPVATRYGVELKLEVDQGKSVVAIGPETFRRILGPVLENALAYAESTVTVKSSTDRMRTVTVTVADDGPGFSLEDLNAAFEPGERGTALRNPSAPTGTGLGLALARRLARANGGDVTILRPGPGAEVQLTLPLAQGSGVGQT